MIGYDEEDGFYGEFIFGENGWTPPGYEDELWKYYWQNRDYAISTHGRVWSCKSNRFLQPRKVDIEGHLGIIMSCHGVDKCAYVHRMVAEMFLPNPDSLPVVRHLDGNPANNIVFNLAWGTQKDNWEDSVRHGTARMFSGEDYEKAHAARRQPIIAISESDGSQIPFPSQREAARELNLYESTICHCLKGRLRHTGGYKFIRAEAEGGEVSADCPK